MPALALLSPLLVLAFEYSRSNIAKSGWLFFFIIAIISSLAGLLYPDVLPRHVNVLYGWLRGLEAHPAFPCFYWDKNDPEQTSSYYTMLVLAGGIGLFYVLCWFSRKSGVLTPSLPWGNARVVAYMFVFFLGMGGLSRANDWFMERDPNRFFEQNIRLARIDYPVRLFAGPVERSGRDPGLIQQSIVPQRVFRAELPRWHAASSGETLASPRVFMGGPYISLFPVNNRVVFEHEANSAVEGLSPGYVEVTASGGRYLIAQKPIETNATRTILSPVVDTTANRVEFRAGIEHPGHIRVNKVIYEAVIGHRQESDD